MVVGGSGLASGLAVVVPESRSGSEVSRFFELCNASVLLAVKTGGMLSLCTPGIPFGEGSEGFLTLATDWSAAGFWRSSRLEVREPRLPDRVESDDLLGEGDG